MTASTKRYLTAGAQAVLVEVDDLSAVLALTDALRRAQISGVTELVPAARTVLVTFDRTTDRDTVVTAIDAVNSGEVTVSEPRVIEIPVRYDGEDLAEVAAHLGITEDDVIRRHTESEYTMAFAGFAPGFCYLTGGDPLLDVPRRSSPRTRIPAGSVGLAGTFSGVYPRSSPGGWQLIGTTDVVMWDEQRDPPALVNPGDRVRFVRANDDDAAVTATGAEPTATEDAPVPATGLRIIRPAAQTLLQDLGRGGHAPLGVPAAGAADTSALRCANRLVGNPADATGLELLLGGLEVECLGSVDVAVAGARTDVTVTRASGAIWSITDQRPIALSAGDRLRLGAPIDGLRSYLAVRGEIEVDPVLGSRSTDTLSEVGPAPLQAGDVLTVRPPASPAPAVGEPRPWPEDRFTTGEVTVPILLGPRQDWFDEDSLDRLTSQPWTVTDRSNRVGLRLHGDQPLERARSGELPSEGAVTGSLQIPPEGQPVLFLNDHPVTGGYPIIAVVAPSALPLVAQAPPGTRLNFVLDSTNTPQETS
ncbi:5-oxoprolinase subunit PxpB [Citricoccus muralis]|uniref:5-oxoprolinase subunit PxpB n=1 Tax=Citricoccus muralis TaxID=169134 RepID=A0ABY8H4F9_9MICC|nr:5-oxoprolinase subunit PxpB [Citricoccus muralis]WFP15542.1 5-oxoprolinase subunit PxpB [Citricoccus muralis]